MRGKLGHPVFYRKTFSLLHIWSRHPHSLTLPPPCFAAMQRKPAMFILQLSDQTHGLLPEELNDADLHLQVNKRD